MVHGGGAGGGLTAGALEENNMSALFSEFRSLPLHLKNNSCYVQVFRKKYS